MFICIERKINACTEKHLILVFLRRVPRCGCSCQGRHTRSRGPFGWRLYPSVQSEIQARSPVPCSEMVQGKNKLNNQINTNKIYFYCHAAHLRRKKHVRLSLADYCKLISLSFLLKVKIFCSQSHNEKVITMKTQSTPLQLGNIVSML